jgi:glucokinase
MLLAGDIGGTKSALALIDPVAGARAPLREARYASQRFPSLQAVVHEFLGTDGRGITSACFGVAGPVVGGRARITNLPWILDETTLATDFGIPSVRLLNDVQATAAAIPALRPDEVQTVMEGDGALHGAIALIAPGTGLGQAFLVWDGTRYRPHASEGGHVEFAPADEIQTALLAHLKRTFPHVSYERVCSGIGIPHIYDFLCAAGIEDERPDVVDELRLAEDRCRAIIEAATAPQASPRSARALEIFVAILGAEAGNLALKVMATGGVYLAGGIPRAIIPALRTPRFRDAFRAKGRLSLLMERIPVHVITGDAALLGAAAVGLEAAAMPGRP